MPCIPPIVVNRNLPVYKFASLFSIALFLSATATAAAPLPPQGIMYSEVGHPFSLLPGRSDGLAYSSFFIGESVYSPNGEHWAAIAVTTASTIALLSGTSRGVTSVALQNEPLPGLNLAFSRTPDSLAINDQGDFAFGMQVVGATSSNGSMITRYSAATRTYVKVARQNDPIPGLNVPGGAGERYGVSLSVAGMLRDGRTGIVARFTSGSLPRDRDDFFLIAGPTATDSVNVQLQVGVSVPTNQSGGGTAVLANLERRASLSADGMRWLSWGQLGNAAFPDAVIVNGRVVIEEGIPVAGLSGTVFSPTTQMFGSGAWVARGSSTTTQSYLIVDGVLRVSEGVSAPGLPELGIVDRVDSAAVNARGDLAYAMSTVDGRAWIVIDPAFGAPFVAVRDRAELTVRGSPRGPIFYGGQLSNSYPISLGDNGSLYFFTRARDRFELTAGDGLFVVPGVVPAIR